MNTNSENPEVGKAFQELTQELLTKPQTVKKKIIAMVKSKHPTRGETLAEYYLRRYEFVLEGITLIEIDSDAKTINKLIE